ncbi:MAG: hypothetical protein EOO92_00430 [Pedobacter sp.]|nr:MAG: hypothetical protein EOO92_00430 [Pedobacter sp.]
MQLLYPIGLLALTSLIIPLVIHLWNVKEGRTLRVGSIGLIGESTTINSKSLRVTDWLLLILRCLLLIILSFMLAEPFISDKLNPTKQKGWLLLEKSDLPSVYKTDKIKVDSLLAKGYEIHDFAPGFTMLTLKDTLVDDRKVSVVSSVSNASLLRALNALLPSGTSVHLFSDRKLTNWDSEIVSVDYKLQLHETQDVDTLQKWSVPFNNKIYEASSTADYTVYTAKAADKKINLEVLIYAENNLADGDYVRAAIAAAGSYADKEIIFHNYKKELVTDGAYDIVFWLSDDKPDDAVLRQLKEGGRLFNYEPGKIQELSSTIYLDGKGLDIAKSVLLNSKIVPKDYLGQPIWVDGFGDPLVSLERTRLYDHYHIYTRLNQEWTGLVWEERFVKAFFPLILGKDEQDSAFGFDSNLADQRVRRGSFFAKSEEKKATNLVNAANKPLNVYFWLCAFAVFALERTLSIRKKERGGHE